MRRSEEEFFASSLAKVVKMLDIADDEAWIKASSINNEPYTPRYFSERGNASETTTITSMKEVEGFL